MTDQELKQLEQAAIEAVRLYVEKKEGAKINSFTVSWEGHPLLVQSWGIPHRRPPSNYD